MRCECGRTLAANVETVMACKCGREHRVYPSPPKPKKGPPRCPRCRVPYDGPGYCDGCEERFYVAQEALAICRTDCDRYVKKNGKDGCRELPRCCTLASELVNGFKCPLGKHPGDDAAAR